MPFPRGVAIVGIASAGAWSGRRFDGIEQEPTTRLTGPHKKHSEP